MAGAILHAMQRFCQAKPWAFSVKRHIASPATVGRLKQYAQWAGRHADSRDAFATGWQAPCQGTPAQASQGCNEIVTAWIETWEGRKGAKPPAETTDAEMQLHLLESWPTLTGVRDHQATIHWSPSIQRTLHGPQIGWLSAASNMMSSAFCTSTGSQGPTPRYAVHVDGPQCPKNRDVEKHTQWGAVTRRAHVRVSRKAPATQ